MSIDGIDLLELQRPVYRPDGSLYPAGPMAYIPTDPVLLLPPDSASLLPTSHPKQAMVGVCSCGEPGCGSLWMQLRRVGDVVVWEPDPQSPWASIDTSWVFALRQYLDAVDEGQRSTTAWETRPRVLARELRRRRDSLHGFMMINAVTKAQLRLLDVRGWPNDDEVLLEVATDQGVQQMHFVVSDDQTDEQVLGTLTRIDPAHFL